MKLSGRDVGLKEMFRIEHVLSRTTSLHLFLFLQFNFSCHFSKYIFLSNQENLLLCSGEEGRENCHNDCSTSPPLALLGTLCIDLRMNLVCTTCHPSQTAGVLQEGPRTINHHPFRGNCHLTVLHQKLLL